MSVHCLEVSAPLACFTRPEMKVERVSYEFITPSAARAVFEAILWKKEFRWRVHKIEVLLPIRWTNLRRNEVGKKAPAASVVSAMNAGRGDLALYVEDERQQRASLLLREVAYRLHAGLEVQPEALAANPPAKYHEMFKRRAERGQCVNQPYLGCREFAADFRLVTDPTAEPPPCSAVDGSYGRMLYDLDFTDPANPQPRFYEARAVAGVIALPSWEEANA